MSIRNWAALLSGALLAWAAQAQELHPDGQSFERRRWTQADGAPQLAVSISQTEDGMLWFGGASGLHSFDGLRFRKMDKVYGQPLLSTNVVFARKVPGGLAVAYSFGGISIFTPGATRHYVAGRDMPRGSTLGLAVSPDGIPHIGTSSGVFALDSGKWRPVGQESLPKGAVSNVTFDKSGRLWAQVGKTRFVRPLGSDSFLPVAVPPDARAMMADSGLSAKLASGEIVMRDLGPTPDQDQYDQPQLYRFPPLRGPHGSLWAPRSDGMARLVRGDDGKLRTAELFAYDGGRDDAFIRASEDREGNLWLATPTGIERYRRQRFHRLPVPPLSFYWLAQRGLGDEMWVGALRAPVERLRPDGSRQATGVDAPVAMLRQAPDHVWLASSDALWEFRGEASQRWDLPANIGQGAEVQSLAQDKDGPLLVSISRNGLWRFAQGQWQVDQRLHRFDDPIPITMLTDAGGRTWVGMTDARLAELTASGATLLPAGAGLRVGNILSMLELGGGLLVGGDLGAAWIKDGRAYALRLERAESFRHITGMVVDHLGSLWMHSDDGLYRASAAALAAFLKSPMQGLEAELFNFQDGIGGFASSVRPLPSLAVAADGRLYYATTSEAGWIDPANISRNTRAPNVLLQSLRTTEREYQPTAGLVLPQRTTAVDLSFTATALSIAERVRIKFRLEGVDQDWREAGPERRAQYTNLTPGSYRFQVIAANEDGVWNKEGAKFSFDIEPAFWQTTWFRTACALAALAAAALLYRWRVAVLQRRAEQHAALRLDAKLQERSRIARSLHDNLLQAVQALLLRFHLVEQKLAQQPELRQMVGSALDYAESLVASTRDEVMELRRPQDADELFAALRHAAAQAAADAEQRLSFTVAGQPRYLRADTCAELSSVLREAVLNSVVHSGARQISVRLTFRDDALLAEASDDGIGLDAAVARHGKTGHWGIPGMRERIARLGGQLDVAPGRQGGVTVQLEIPAQQAYI